MMDSAGRAPVLQTDMVALPATAASTTVGATAGQAEGDVAGSPRGVNHRPLLSRLQPSARSRALLQLQRHHGNQRVQRWLAGVSRESIQSEPQSIPIGRLPGPVIDRADPEPDPNLPLDVAGLRLRQELPGAGFDIQRSSDLTSQVQRQATSPMPVRANVSLTVNSPTVQIAPGAQIGQAHGRPGAVGWTTPSYDLQVDPRSTVSAITITVTLGFVIELPSDYDAQRQAVVSDHEIGHIRIGERKAKEHLVDGLKSSLEASGGPLTRSSVQGALSRAATNFVDAERTGSDGYDAADYPRMVEAYRGVRTPLRTLAAQSPAISQMVRQLRRLSSGLYSAVRSYDEARLEGIAAGVTGARGALSNQELWRLQYNREFQGLVGQARQSVASFLSGAALLGTGLESLPESMQPHLVSIQTALGGFTFSPTAASAGF